MSDLKKIENLLRNAHIKAQKGDEKAFGHAKILLKEYKRRRAIHKQERYKNEEINSRHRSWAYKGAAEDAGSLVDLAGSGLSYLGEKYSDAATSLEDSDNILVSTLGHNLNSPERLARAAGSYIPSQEDYADFTKGYLDDFADPLVNSENPLYKAAGHLLRSPVDLVDAALYGPSLGGTESLKSGMKWLGMELPSREPESIREHALQGLGGAPAFLIPSTAAVKVVSKLGRYGAKLSSALTKPFKAAPVRAVALETAAGAGAGAGGEVIDRYAGEGSNPVARFAGQIGGGMAAAMSPGIALRGARTIINKIPVAEGVYDTVASGAVPFTEAGARVLASDRFRSVVDNPKEVAERLRQPDIGNLSPAQKSGKKGIIEIENYLASTDPKFRTALAEQTDSSRGILAAKTNISNSTLDDTFNQLKKGRDQFQQSMDNRIKRAKKKAFDVLEDIKPQLKQSQASINVRQQIDAAYNQSLNTERSLWDKIPLDTKVKTKNVRSVLADIKQKTPKAQTGDIPSEAFLLKKLPEASEENKLLQEIFGGPIPKEIKDPFGTVNELYGLYSKLRQTQREALVGPVPRKNRARIANKLANAILEDLGAIDPTTKIGILMNDARSFSHTLNKTFNQGTVGRLTRIAQESGDSINPGTALKKTVGRLGVEGSEAAKEIRKATTGADPYIEDYLKSRFAKNTRIDGPLDPKKGGSFLRDNEEIIEQYPGLSKKLVSAIDVQKNVGKIETKISDRLKRLDNPRESASAAFLKKDRGNELDSIFNKYNPVESVKALRELRRQAVKDKSGKALDGLKDGVINYVMEKASSGFDVRGVKKTSGESLAGILSHDKSILDVVLSPGEISRLNKIADEFKALNLSESGVMTNTMVSNKPQEAIQFLIGVIAARYGAKLGANTGGASLKTSSMLVQRWNKGFQRLTDDKAKALVTKAIKDPDLMAQLLEPLTPENTAEIQRRLIEALTGTSAVVISEENKKMSDRLSNRGSR